MESRRVSKTPSLVKPRSIQTPNLLSQNFTFNEQIETVSNNMTKSATTKRYDDNNDFDDDGEEPNEVILAIDMKERGTVGCAYYVAMEETLYFMEDAKFGGVDVVQNCKCSSIRPFI
jgi:DNA mismatch repair protein MSH5